MQETTTEFERSSHVRFLVWIPPPHDSVHVDHAFHVVQRLSNSIMIISNNIVLLKWRYSQVNHVSQNVSQKKGDLRMLRSRSGWILFEAFLSKFDANNHEIGWTTYLDIYCNPKAIFKLWNISLKKKIRHVTNFSQISQLPSADVLIKGVILLNIFNWIILACGTDNLFVGDY